MYLVICQYKVRGYCIVLWYKKKKDIHGGTFWEKMSQRLFLFFKFQCKLCKNLDWLMIFILVKASRFFLQISKGHTLNLWARQVNTNVKDGPWKGLRCISDHDERWPHFTPSRVPADCTTCTFWWAKNLCRKRNEDVRGGDRGSIADVVDKK